MADDFDLVKISELPAATAPGEYDVLAGVQSGDTKQFSFSVLLAWMQQAITASAIGAVPITRKVNGKALSTDITLTAADVGAYALPSGGIPKTDLAQGVKDSLDNADSAYQMPSGGIPSSDMASAVQTSLGLADTAYQKPSSGIPATDLASGVIPTVPTAYASNPEMDGTASPGSSGSWANGDHVHPSDTTKANQSQIAYVESGSTASRAYAVGEYFCWNGLLYWVKTAISSGGTITPGTNCEQAPGGGFNAILPAITDGTVTTTKASGFVQTFSVAGLCFTYFKITTSVVTSTTDVLATVPAAYSPLLRAVPVEFLYQRPTDSAPIIREDRAGIWLESNGEIMQRLSNSWPANTLMQGLFIYTR